MSRTVQCASLGREAPGLERTPYPGALGERIYNEVSQEAWQSWLAHQTMLINENHLSPRKAEDRRFLEGEMTKFLFEGATAKPVGFIPVTNG